MTDRARAAYEAFWSRGEPPIPWRDLSEHLRDAWRDVVAALAAPVCTQCGDPTDEPRCKSCAMCERTGCENVACLCDECASSDHED